MVGKEIGFREMEPDLAKLMSSWTQKSRKSCNGLPATSSKMGGSFYESRVSIFSTNQNSVVLLNCEIGARVVLMNFSCR